MQVYFEESGGNNLKKTQFPTFERFGSLGDPHPLGFLHDWPDMVARRLGYYALFDYYPPAVPIGVATKVGRIAANGFTKIWEPKWLYMPRGQGDTSWGSSLMATSWTSYYPVDTFLGGSAAGGNAVAVVDRDFVIVGNNNKPVSAGNNRVVYSVNYAVAFTTDLFSSDIVGVRILPTNAPPPLLAAAPSGPTGFPDARVTMRHLIANGTFIDHAQVRVDDPLTGEVLATTVSAVTTTLRGARINRQVLDVLP